MLASNPFFQKKQAYAYFCILEKISEMDTKNTVDYDLIIYAIVYRLLSDETN